MILLVSYFFVKTLRFKFCPILTITQMLLKNCKKMYQILPFIALISAVQNIQNYASQFCSVRSQLTIQMSRFTYHKYASDLSQTLLTMLTMGM